jgi:hypothetical protein
MPTVSRQQQKLMHGIASGNIPPGNGKPTKAVAQDFANADHKRGAKKLPQNVGGAIVRGMPAKEME